MTTICLCCAVVGRAPAGGQITTGWTTIHASFIVGAIDHHRSVPGCQMITIIPIITITVANCYCYYCFYDPHCYYCFYDCFYYPHCYYCYYLLVIESADWW